MNEGFIRFAAFAGIFLIMALLELALPKRKLNARKSHRWLANLLFAGVDSLIVRLMGMLAVPIVAMTAALYAENQGWGLFNIIDLPVWLEVLIAIVVLDFAIYIQHVVSHKIPMLWSFHKVHHTDVDIDVTTAIRFHPVEIFLSMLYKIVVVFILGPAAVAVVAFEVMLNGTAMFNHANVALPRWLDIVVRTLFVTPDMHRIHHSVIRRETDSNYGFSLSIWDRMFRTYNEQPKDGHDAMSIGLPQYQDDRPTRFTWSFMLPFRTEPDKPSDQ